MIGFDSCFDGSLTVSVEEIGSGDAGREMGNDSPDRAPEADEGVAGGCNLERLVAKLRGRRLAGEPSGDSDCIIEVERDGRNCEVLGENVLRSVGDADARAADGSGLATVGESVDFLERRSLRVKKALIERPCPRTY